MTMGVPEVGNPKGIPQEPKRKGSNRVDTPDSSLMAGSSVPKPRQSPHAGHSKGVQNPNTKGV